MKHPGITKLFDFFEDDEFVYLIQEYCSGGDLWNYLKSRQQKQQKTRSGSLSSSPPLAVLCEEETRGIMLQIGRSLVYIHQRGILHRDLKLTNLLVTDDMEIQITDFGLATQIDDNHDDKNRLKMGADPMTVCGTFNYMSPEITAGNTGYGFESDIWALGCLFVTFLTGFSPFEEIKHQQHNSRGRVDYHAMLAKIRLPSGVSDEARDLATRLLQIKPQKRISTRDLLNHPFFSPSLPTKILKPLSHFRNMSSPSESEQDDDDDKEEEGLKRGNRYLMVRNGGGNDILTPLERVGTRARKIDKRRPPIYPMSAEASSNPTSRAGRRALAAPPGGGGRQQQRPRIGDQNNTLGGGRGYNTNSRLLPDTMITSVPLETSTNVSYSKQQHQSTRGGTAIVCSSGGESEQINSITYLSTKRLQARRHKQDNRALEIMTDGRISLEVAGENYIMVVDPTATNDNNSSKKLYLFPHGTAIFEPSKASQVFNLTSIDNDDGNKLLRTLLRRVQYIVRCIDIIRSKTTKITLKTSQGLGMLMENLPVADFHFKYRNKIKVSYQRRKRMAEIRIPSEQDLPDEIHRVTLSGNGRDDLTGLTSDRLRRILEPVKEALSKCIAADKLVDQWESGTANKSGDYEGKIKYPVTLKWEEDLTGYIPPGLVKSGRRRGAELHKLNNLMSSGSTVLETKPNKYHNILSLGHHPTIESSSTMFSGRTRVDDRDNMMYGGAIDEADEEMAGNTQFFGRKDAESRRPITARPISYPRVNHPPLFHNGNRNSDPNGLGNNKNNGDEAPQLAHPLAIPGGFGASTMQPIVAGSSDRFQFIANVGWCIYRPITDSNHTRYLVTPQRNYPRRNNSPFVDHEFILLFTDGIMMVVDSTRQHIGWWDQFGNTDIPEQQFRTNRKLPKLVERKFRYLPLFIDSMDLDQ